MADLIRPLRGAFPGPGIEPDAAVRAQLAQLGQVGVRYGGAIDNQAPPSFLGFGQWIFSDPGESGHLLTAGF